MAHGILERNPSGDIRPSDALKHQRAKNYLRQEARDVPELLRKIEGYAGAPHTRLATKLMALTFVRTGELIGAKWGGRHLNRRGTPKAMKIPLDEFSQATSALRSEDGVTQKV